MTITCTAWQLYTDLGTADAPVPRDYVAHRKVVRVRGGDPALLHTTE